MVYISLLAIVMVITVVYLMVGGISLLKSDELEQEQVDKELHAALLK